ncbi:NAD-dependent epimerase/dehydratase family protein [Acrocarpospora catenulata]|uniref:NAD-dependent epimerase/dehydratase family protein n=1 Tax=Acrocarpospora catenulata TaxID=2836182 RepID=UPI001BD9300C|nr:NAD-dependent epimerase/dehydratase family protein [Acrocarpospora catenulata]
MTRVLLTGASGFVGRHVAELLAGAPGVELILTRRRELTHCRVVDLAAGPYDALCRVLAEAEPSVVVNCAGVVHGESAALVAGNVTAPARLLRAMADVVPDARLVHVGSAAEYGAHAVPVREDAECRPLGEYGLTKLAGTALVRAAALDGLDAVVLRLFNPVGPGASGGSLTGRLIAGLRAGDEVLLGVTTDVRDFIDVRDAAAAIVAAALARGPLPPVLNLGTGRAVPVQELVDTMISVAAWPGRVLSTPSAGGSTLPWSCADITAITQALPWRPAIPLRTTLADAWQT